MLSDSILRNRGVLRADKTIKYKTEASVLKLRVGDEICIDEAQFFALFRVYFSSIQQAFT